MASTDITVKIDYEMTDTSREVLRQVVAGIMAEVLAKTPLTANEDELRAIVQDEICRTTLDLRERPIDHG